MGRLVLCGVLGPRHHSGRVQVCAKQEKATLSILSNTLALGVQVSQTRPSLAIMVKSTFTIFAVHVIQRYSITNYRCGARAKMRGLCFLPRGQAPPGGKHAIDMFVVPPVEFDCGSDSKLALFLPKLRKCEAHTADSRALLVLKLELANEHVFL